MLVRKGGYAVIQDSPGGESSKPTGGPGGGPQTTLSDVAAGRQVGARGATPRAARGGADKIPPPIDWKGALASGAGLMGRHMTENGRRILAELTKKPALIDWKKYIRKFVDRVMSRDEPVMPKRRFVGSGIYLSGHRRVGKEGFRTAVLACDTSTSISQDQTKTFLIEAMAISESFFIDRLIILYCSDQVDNVDDVDLRRKQRPDFTKWRSTGGNRGGFSHPFDWLEREKIVPSFLIYFTDGIAEFPGLNPHTRRYKDRVLWFILKRHDLAGGDYGFGDPKFGRVFDIPMQSMPGAE